MALNLSAQFQHFSQESIIVGVILYNPGLSHVLKAHLYRICNAHKTKHYLVTSLGSAKRHSEEHLQGGRADGNEQRGIGRFCKNAEQPYHPSCLRRLEVSAFSTMAYLHTVSLPPNSQHKYHKSSRMSSSDLRQCVRECRVSEMRVTVYSSFPFCHGFYDVHTQTFSSSV